MEAFPRWFLPASNSIRCSSIIPVVRRGNAADSGEAKHVADDMRMYNRLRRDRWTYRLTGGQRVHICFFDPLVALKGARWGRGQLTGFHAPKVGFLHREHSFLALIVFLCRDLAWMIIDLPPFAQVKEGTPDIKNMSKQLHYSSLC